MGTMGNFIYSTETCAGWTSKFLGRPDSVLNIAWLPGHPHCTRFQAGHIEEIANQAIHPIRFISGGID
jgi:hypothetical protein